MAVKRYVSQLKKILGSQQLRKQGSEVYRNTIPTRIRPAEDDTIITAGDADRLDSLAAKYYGLPSLWYVLASVNGLADGTMHVKPGTQLRIPARSRIIG